VGTAVAIDERGVVVGGAARVAAWRGASEVATGVAVAVLGGTVGINRSGTLVGDGVIMIVGAIAISVAADRPK